MISVIVPVYNVENYLERCIRSIINQTFKDMEIFLIDDGSTDKSGDICDYYSKVDPRINIIHKKNEGLAATRNLGIEISKGEYLIFIDSDDFINKDMIMCLYKKSKKYNADIVSCQYRKVLENEIIDENQSIESNDRLFTNIEAIEEYLENKNECEKIFHTVIWNKLYNKRIFKNIRFPSGKLYEDGYVTYKLLYLANKVVSIDEVYYYYYHRLGSIMNRGFTEKELLSYDDWKEIFHFIQSKEDIRKLEGKAAENYINKHIKLYVDIYDKNSEIAIKYKRLIKKDLKKDFKKLIRTDIGILNKIRLISFNVNVYLYKIIQKNLIVLRLQ